MQILKVLLVVLVAVNLTTGFFFPKKKKIYIHHPAPAPVYPQYTYSYYYQPIPYYYYEPVYVATHHPTPAPVHPKEDKPEVEIVPSVGFQMGTKTDVIEVLKSPGVEVQPVQPVQTDAGSTTVIIDEIKPDANDVKLSSGGVVPIVNSEASAQSSFSSTDLLINSVPSVSDIDVRGSFNGNSDNTKRGASTVEVYKSPGEYIEFPPVAIQNDDETLSALLTDQAFPPNSDLSSSLSSFSASQSFAQSQALTSTLADSEQDSVFAASSDSVSHVKPPSEDALAFPEVQQVLRELLNTKNFDEKRFKKDTTTSGGVPQRQSVQIDPEISYSKVVRQ
ncbi:uncharacterized protein LOC126568119 [Anopheles maculipalpis]|uniref:uncharacterized protein LOC126568119 n=1 Tax=Anopheles maculipalpis TaxID=1496333 RepID=UPI0021591DA9|nr:uncharacterized protein LOC126568119 [Anopheles maculipalpis]